MHTFIYRLASCEALVIWRILSTLFGMSLLLASLVAARADSSDAAREHPVSLTLSPTWLFKGKSSAPITVIEFHDYQCVYCKRFRDSAYPLIEAKYIRTGLVRFYTRSLPQDIFTYSVESTHSALCARDQQKYWVMDALLMSASPRLRPELLINFAEKAGLDMAKYKECVDSKRHAKEIDADKGLASSLNITGSPSFLVGRAVGDKFVGLVLGGAHPFEVFDGLITRTLRHRKYASLQEDDRIILYTSAALKKHPHDTVALLDRAKARRNRSMVKEALNDVERALRLDRALPMAYVERGIILSMMGNENAAIADFTHAISLSPNLSEPYFRRGISLENTKRFEQAKLDYERAKALATNDARPSFYLAMHYLRDSKYAAAVSEFDVAAKINYSWAMIPRYRAVAHEALSELDKAAYDFQNAAYLDKSVSDYFEAVRLFKSLGKWRDAVFSLRMAADLQPSSVIFLKLGMAEARAGEMDAAIASFSRAIEVDADSAGAFLQRCIARVAKGEEEAAFADCDRAVELDPKASAARATRGALRLAADRANAALSDFDAAVEARPDYAEALFGRGLAKERLGDLSGAVEDRRKAEGILPTVEQQYRSLVITTDD